MSNPGVGGARLIRGTARETAEDAVKRSVAATVHNALAVLSRAARAREFDNPATAGHIHRLSQHIAGITLDALRTWPEATE